MSLINLRFCAHKLEKFKSIAAHGLKTVFFFIFVNALRAHSRICSRNDDVYLLVSYPYVYLCEWPLFKRNRKKVNIGIYNVRISCNIPLKCLSKHMFCAISSEDTN